MKAKVPFRVLFLVNFLMITILVLVYESSYFSLRHFPDSNSTPGYFYSRRLPRPISGASSKGDSQSSDIVNSAGHDPPSLVPHSSQNTESHIGGDVNSGEVETLADSGSNVNNRIIKTILFWTGFYAHPASEWKFKVGEFDCGQHRCTLTYNRSRYSESNALVFHHRCPSWAKDMAELVADEPRLINQRWILYNRESVWWGKCEECDGVNGLVNWTMGFRRDDDVSIPTAVVKRGRYLDGFDPNKNYMEGKTGHVAVLMSMCNWGGYKSRSRYITLLKRSGLHIDIHGQCGKKCSNEDCIKALKKYKFYLALENSLCDDYISEKAYIHGFRLGTVPIVMSKANISDPSILPPGSFIDGLAFPDAAALVKHINTVGSDQKLYNAYFEWRANWTFTMVSENEGHVPYPDDYFCPLCEKLHSTSEPSKSIQDLRQWYEQEKCQPHPTH